MILARLGNLASQRSRKMYDYDQTTHTIIRLIIIIIIWIFIFINTINDQSD